MNSIFRRTVGIIGAETLIVEMSNTSEPISLYTTSGYEALSDDDAVRLAEALLAAVSARKPAQ